MSTVNHLAREVAAKIVFYGPGLSGKTTTLKRIHGSVKPAHRGEMMSLPTEADRTLFFDFLPVKVERVGDCAVRLALYTVPGQVFYNATRKLVLQGADGVVFVADSQPAAMDSNLESLRNLEDNLQEQGIRLDRFPVVIQYNKRDIAGALPVEELRAALNPRGVPDFETCATNGQGVLDTLKAITRLVIKDLRSKRVVPPPRPSAPARSFPSLAAPSAALEDQIQEHLNTHSVETMPAQPPQAGEADSPLSELDADQANGDGHAPEPQAPQNGEAHRRADPPAVAGRLPLGPATALAPSALADHARAADFAFLRSDHEGCVRACQEAVRRALTYAGEGTSAAQAYLLGVDGRDLLRLEQLSTRTHLRVDDAALALYVLMQVFTRLTAAGLPVGESVT